MWPLTILLLLSDPSSHSAEFRCGLLQAVVSARGTIDFGGRRVDIGPAFGIASTTRLGDRVVVEPWLKVGRSLEDFLGAGQTCEEKGFRLVRDLAKTPPPWGKIKVTIALTAAGKGQFLWRQTSRPELVPKDQYTAEDPWCYYGEFEMKSGTWTARLTSMKGGGSRCFLKGGITWR